MDLDQFLDRHQDWSTVTLTVVAGILLIVLIVTHCHCKRNQNRANSHGESICSSHNCVRCHRGTQLNELVDKCREYVTDVHSVNVADVDVFLASNYPRVVSTIHTIKSRQKILCDIFKESGTELSLSHPHVWMIPGVKRSPFWENTEECTQFRADLAVDIVKQEYTDLHTQSGWKVNTVSRGQWQIYKLYDQGEKLTENCKHCPQTVAMIESLPNFMKGCVYGNAMFSVLEPGSHIEPHIGPCNFRLRCHFPLIAPEGWVIQVGTQERSWEEGRLMVIDDSFVHSVKHKASSSMEKRVVLIFDLWHPQVMQSERKMFADVFSNI